jgi:hypothetical protein
MFSFALPFHSRQNCSSSYLESAILSKVKTPYWRTAIWAAVILVQSSLMCAYVLVGPNPPPEQETVAMSGLLISAVTEAELLYVRTVEDRHR